MINLMINLAFFILIYFIIGIVYAIVFMAISYLLNFQKNEVNIFCYTRSSLRVKAGELFMHIMWMWPFFTFYMVIMSAVFILLWSVHALPDKIKKIKFNDIMAYLIFDLLCDKMISRNNNNDQTVENGVICNHKKPLSPPPGPK